jgi:hypothetical protein
LAETGGLGHVDWLLFLHGKEKGPRVRSFFGFVALSLFYQVDGKLNALSARDFADWNVLFAKYFGTVGIDRNFVENAEPILLFIG